MVSFVFYVGEVFFHLKSKSEFLKEVKKVKGSFMKQLLSVDKKLCEEQDKVDDTCVGCCAGDSKEESPTRDIQLYVSFPIKPTNDLLPESLYKRAGEEEVVNCIR